MLTLKTEKQILNQGYKVIGALDEAGRGPLAGPVVAACVVFDRELADKTKALTAINDSKKLSAKKREELFAVVYNEFSEVGVGICDQDTIDRINILQAAFLAMKKAISSLSKKPDYIILDGSLAIPNISLQQRAIIKGDAKVLAIAAASIIAKVTRDRIMEKMHKRYPQYEFDRHKGYGTKLHFARLAQYGPCPFHRKSFAPIKKYFSKEK